MFFVVVAGVLCAPIFPVALRRLRSKWGGARRSKSQASAVLARRFDQEENGILRGDRFVPASGGATDSAACSVAGEKYLREPSARRRPKPVRL